MITNRILVVCTANMIRSPFIAELLRSRLAGGHGAVLDIDSAGTAARPGDLAAAGIVERARPFGLDLEHHRTRRLHEGILQTGDTVLCAERAHRRVVLDLRPDLISSVFTVREFARCAEAISTENGATTWPGLVRAARARSSARPGGEDDDIVDPIGQADEVWSSFEGQSTRAVSSILAAIANLPRIDAETAANGPVPATRREYRRMRRADASGHPAGWRN